eukprot:5585350-Prymnesium_polylepis.1
MSKRKTTAPTTAAAVAAETEPEMDVEAILDVCQLPGQQGSVVPRRVAGLQRPRGGHVAAALEHQAPQRLQGLHRAWHLQQ